MSCEIIQFSAAARLARRVSDKQAPVGVTAIGNRVLTPRQRRREGKPELPPATETAKNARIRTERRDAWWLAERAADYWHARWKWHDELETAQRYGIGDSESFPPPAPASPLEAVDKWREAVAKQLLTPAPTLADVAWKRAKIKSDEFNQLPISLARAEKAIADDLALLAAHPTRRAADPLVLARKRSLMMRCDSGSEI
jgi:hypothetical protein